jgi:CTP:molybdopterin cytidylyltransferase MocA
MLRAASRSASASGVASTQRPQVGVSGVSTDPHDVEVSVHAVVLAAGASSRYGTSPPKQAELLPPVLAALRRSSALSGVVVVTGAHDVTADARVVRCADWSRGPGASLRCGLESLPADAQAAVVALADGPHLDARAVDRVIAAWRQTGGDVFAASYDGIRLHPVLLARAVWNRVPDEGARGLPAHLVACDDLEPPGDVDVRE